MRIPNEYSTLLWSSLLAPVVAGLPACFLYWMIFPDQPFYTFHERLSSATFYTTIIAFAGVHRWFIVSLLGAFITLYFIPKTNFKLRFLVSLLIPPLPTYFVCMKADGIAQTINPDILWASLSFSMASAILLVSLTRNIDLPPQTN